MAARSPTPPRRPPPASTGRAIPPRRNRAPPRRSVRAVAVAVAVAAVSSFSLGPSSLPSPPVAEAFAGAAPARRPDAAAAFAASTIGAPRSRAGFRPGRPRRAGPSPSVASAAGDCDCDGPSLAPPRLSRLAVQLVTSLRVGLPSVAAGLVSARIFPILTARIGGVLLSGPATAAGSAASAAMMGPDATSYVEQFLSVAGLLFGLLLGQTYGFLYAQQESVYYALFEEVTEAKSLLEQVSLSCRGRAMFPRVLEQIDKYVEEDLTRVDADPAVLLSARPADDPLEAIMYMTSVGVPGTVYQTVKSLRTARARRLGALQRKVPPVHMVLLWALALCVMMGFPLLGACRLASDGVCLGVGSVRSVEGVLFGVMAFAIVMTKRVVGELLRPRGGAYNVDATLGVMVRGLKRELKQRMCGG